ncbi:MAG: tRNA (adenosine(37)-N6)-threonylcarbamoyltransferase complex ATPase subunit type 1 TsaE [Methylococcales bacterium]|jgi:tRNA threonylcarbamoyladenosine biosynthesis protein TsaE|nr:tRNA (adenosine(37)-N6)-threonylcarbamoyltransferase complex ATPase subunit type 1 TsaE [Methylococcales bacterium]MBT7411352.1 tRNA (adenosine(37)-N6)-threonylcarbamoyltransferase complex ATPase subunit type 1 TsaE [Methylococcales bacterium]
MEIICQDEESLADFARQISKKILPGSIVFLQGDLGVGKTTFVRKYLLALGFKGHVKSPTYSIVESYQLSQIQVAHFDLYRLSDGEELEYMGFREYLDAQSICFIEWPEKASGFLPEADMVISLEYHQQGRIIKVDDDSTIDYSGNS